MLFHVSAEHDHLTCPGREGGMGAGAVREAQKWIEGNADVKVLVANREREKSPFEFGRSL